MWQTTWTMAMTLERVCPKQNNHFIRSFTIAYFLSFKLNKFDVYNCFATILHFFSILPKKLNRTTQIDVLANLCTHMKKYVNGI